MGIICFNTNYNELFDLDYDSAGQSVKLTTSNFIDVVDDDNAADVVITMTYPPKHGRVVRLPNYEKQILSFTVG